MFFTADGEPLRLENHYRNSSCFVISGGPSIKDVDLDKLRQPGIVTMGINNSPKVFRPDLWVMGDDVKNFMISIYKDPKIMKFIPKAKSSHTLFDNTIWESTSLRVGDCSNIVYYNRNEAFDPSVFLSEETVNWGNHTDRCECGYMRKTKALCKKENLEFTKICPECGKEQWGSRFTFVSMLKILYSLGFMKVFLLGCDFRMKEGASYGWDQEKKGGAVRGNNKHYIRNNGRCESLRPYFEKENFFVFNCTMDSGLTAFESIPFDLALKMALKDFPDTKTERSSGMYERKALLKAEAKKKAKDAARKAFREKHKKWDVPKPSKDQGVLYYNTGFGAFVRMVVSINTMRKYYSGPITIICDGDSFEECKNVADKYQTDVIKIQLQQFPKNTCLLNRCLIHKVTPYELSIYVDSDTIILGKIDRLFRWAHLYEYVVAQFADWDTRDGRIRDRILEFSDWYPDAMDGAVNFGNAINCGMFAFRRDSKFMADWFEKAKIAYELFIPEEKCCQALLHKYPHLIAPHEYNESCKFGQVTSMTKIMHFHGRKHARISEGKYLYNADRWYAEFEKVEKLDFVQRHISSDSQLRKNWDAWQSLR